MEPVHIDVDLRSAAFKDDPVPTWRRLQSAGDVVTTHIPLLGEVGLATRRDAARRVLEEPELFAVDARLAGHRSRAGTRWWVPPSFGRLADNLLSRDGAEHRTLRRRVEHAFRKPSLAGLQSRIDARCDACLDAFERGAGRGGERGAPHDFVRDIARPLPMGVIGDLLGLDPDESAPHRPLGRAIARLSGVEGAVDLFRLVPAMRTVAGSMRAGLAARRSSPGDDFLSVLAEAIEIDAGGTDPFDERAAVSMVFLLYVAGHETTTHLLSASVLELLRRPGLLGSMPADVGPGTVGELMRWLSPVQFAKPRFVTRDVELGGAVLRRGSTVTALIGAANVDDRVFEAPERPDFARAPSRHLGFGAGAHTCLGLQLALRETSTVLERFFGRFPDVRLAAPGDVPDWSERSGLRALRSLPLSIR